MSFLYRSSCFTHVNKSVYNTLKVIFIKCTTVSYFRMEETLHITKIIVSISVFNCKLCGLWWKPEYRNIVSLLIGMSHNVYNGIKTWVAATMELATIAEVSVPMAAQLLFKLPLSSRFWSQFSFCSVESSSSSWIMTYISFWTSSLSALFRPRISLWIV